MEFEKSINGKTATVKASGKLDSVGAPEFTAAMDGIAKGMDEVVLDFEHVSYISSAGLRSVLKLVMGSGKKTRISIVNADGMTAEVFRTAGFGSLLR
ncbi:MAG: STAS domain-containing protein [Thermoplasmata archaeon]|nr:STAS domain-containing protein [Thermoplasmata archaeon]